MKTYFVCNRKRVNNTTSRIAATLVLGAGVVLTGASTQVAQAQVGRGGVTVAPAVPHVAAPVMPSVSAPVMTTVRPSVAPSMPSISSPGFGRLGITTPFQSPIQSSSAFRNNSGGSTLNLPAVTHTGPVLPPVPYTARITQTTPAAVNNILSNGTSYNRFNNTAEANGYRFGVQHNHRYYYGDYYGFGYFPGYLAYSPLYAPYFATGYTALSPYADYNSALPPYIVQNGVLNSQPPYVYVPYPVYQNGIYQGMRDQENSDVDNYYLNQNPDKSQRPGKEAERSGNNGDSGRSSILNQTISDLQNAWTRGKLDLLAKHVQRDMRISVFLRGKYQYSLDSGDYLDMTRDAFAATKTVRFELDTIQRQGNDIYTVTGRHIYRDKNVTSVPGDITAPDPKAEHTVHVTYVLQKIDNDYIITQVGTAPDRVEE